MTAAVLFTSYLKSQSAFSVMPLCKSKSANYIKIGWMFGFFYLLGNGYVAKNFGDPALTRYLAMNRGAIIRGEKSFDRE